MLKFNRLYVNGHALYVCESNKLLCITDFGGGFRQKPNGLYVSVKAKWRVILDSVVKFDNVNTYREAKELAATLI
jgi:ribulose 1,5-bisphosphate carboxylase large subunit-like protein